MGGGAGDFEPRDQLPHSINSHTPGAFASSRIGSEARGSPIASMNAPAQSKVSKVSTFPVEGRTPVRGGTPLRLRSVTWGSRRACTGGSDEVSWRPGTTLRHCGNPAVGSSIDSNPTGQRGPGRSVGLHVVQRFDYAGDALAAIVERCHAVQQVGPHSQSSAIVGEGADPTAPRRCGQPLRWYWQPGHRVQADDYGRVFPSVVGEPLGDAW